MECHPNGCDNLSAYSGPPPRATRSSRILCKDKISTYRPLTTISCKSTSRKFKWDVEFANYYTSDLIYLKPAEFPTTTYTEHTMKLSLLPSPILLLCIRLRVPTPLSSTVQTSLSPATTRDIPTRSFALFPSISGTWFDICIATLSCMIFPAGSRRKTWNVAVIVPKSGFLSPPRE